MAAGSPRAGFGEHEPLTHVHLHLPDTRVPSDRQLTPRLRVDRAAVPRAASGRGSVSLTITDSGCPVLVLVAGVSTVSAEQSSNHWRLSRIQAFAFAASLAPGAGLATETLLPR